MLRSGEDGREGIRRGGFEIKPCLCSGLELIEGFQGITSETIKLYRHSELNRYKSLQVCVMSYAHFPPGGGGSP